MTKTVKAASIEKDIAALVLSDFLRAFDYIKLIFIERVNLSYEDH